MNPIVEFVTQYYNKTLTEISLPTLAYPRLYSVFSGMSQLSYVSLPRLKSMTANMFSGCTQLSSVYMPEVASVANSVFYRCWALRSVAFPYASYVATGAFGECSQLSSVSLPKVTSVGSNAFFRCGLSLLELPCLRTYTTSQGPMFAQGSNLVEISLPALTKVGSDYYSAALASECTALTHLYLPNCVTIVGGVYGCTGLDFSGIDAPNALAMKQVALGGSNSAVAYSALTEIAHSTLQTLTGTISGNVPNLSRIYLPEVSTLSLDHYGSNVSLSSPNLTEIYLPKLRYIDGSMFPYAPVTSLTIPWSQIETIRAYIVTSSAPCISTITELSLPACTYLGRAPFGSYNAYLVSLYCGATEAHASFRQYAALRNVTFPNASSVATHMFLDCPSLESVSFPKAKQIANGAFMIDASSYYSVSTPELHLNFPECMYIDNTAFMSNKKLRELHLSVCSQINGNSTFYRCSNFMSLYLYSTAVVTLQYNADYVFAGTPMRQSVNGVYGSIFVPASLITNYQTNGSWSWVKDRFVALPE